MRRWLIRLVVFLLLGAVVNVAVAWACAIFIEVNDGIEEEAYLLYKTNERFGTVLLSERRSEGASRVYGVVMPWRDKPPPGFGIQSDLTRRSVRVFARAGLDEANWSQLSVLDALWVDSRGWPLVALYSVGAFEIEPNILTTLGGIEITPLPDQRNFGPRDALGLRPIWPGFAINTIFYAAILSLLTLGPFIARRFIRHKRGRCIKCGYDLRGAEHAVCPECGCELHTGANA